MSWNVRVKIPADEFWGDLEGETLAGAERVVDTAAELAVARIKQILSVSSDTPAIEGEAPRKRKGDLIRSIKREPAKRAGDRVFARVYSDDIGAAHTEFGHVEPDKQTGARSGKGHVGKMSRPHPFFRPAFEELQGKIAALFHAWAEGR